MVPIEIGSVVHSNRAETSELAVVPEILQFFIEYLPSFLGLICTGISVIVLSSPLDLSF